MKAPARFLNKSSGEELFKEAAGVDRFESGVWDHVEQLCFDYFVELAKLAGEKVREDGRTVIDVADVVPPEGSGVSTPTPESLLEKLHKLADDDVSQIAKFGKLITRWVEAEKKKDQ
jgi:histone H3/H4